MKQVLRLLFLLLFSVLPACGPEALPEISLEAGRLEFTGEGGKATVSLKSNCGWTASVPSDVFFGIVPASGTGDATIEISVPASKEIEDRGYTLNFTAEKGGQIAMAKLHIVQKAQPGWASFSDVRAYDEMTKKRLPEGTLTPFRGYFSMKVEANSEWTLTCNPPVQHIGFERGWEGVKENYVYYSANVGGSPIEYRFQLDCQTTSGGGGQTLVMVQPPSEGSMRVLGITGSADGQTIPATGADLSLQVKANTLWQVMTDANLSYSGLGYDNEDTVVIHIPPCDAPDGRTIRLWLRLSEVLDTEFIELVQR